MMAWVRDDPLEVIKFWCDPNMDVDLGSVFDFLYHWEMSILYNMIRYCVFNMQ